MPAADVDEALERAQKALERLRKTLREGNKRIGSAIASAAEKGNQANGEFVEALDELVDLVDAKAPGLLDEAEVTTDDARQGDPYENVAIGDDDLPDPELVDQTSVLEDLAKAWAERDEAPDNDERGEQWEELDQDEIVEAINDGTLNPVALVAATERGDHAKARAMLNAAGWELPEGTRVVAEYGEDDETTWLRVHVLAPE